MNSAKHFQPTCEAIEKAAQCGDADEVVRLMGENKKDWDAFGIYKLAELERSFLRKDFPLAFAVKGAFLGGHFELGKELLASAERQFEYYNIYHTDLGGIKTIKDNLLFSAMVHSIKGQHCECLVRGIGEGLFSKKEVFRHLTFWREFDFILKLLRPGRNQPTIQKDPELVTQFLEVWEDRNIKDLIYLLACLDECSMRDIREQIIDSAQRSFPKEYIEIAKKRAQILQDIMNAQECNYWQAMFWEFDKNYGYFLSTLNKLPKTGEKSMVQILNTLKENLDQARVEASHRPLTKDCFAMFESICRVAIDDAAPALEQYHDLRQILLNLLLCFAGLAIGYALAGAVNRATTGNFLFFKPEIAKQVDEMKTSFYFK